MVRAGFPATTTPGGGSATTTTGGGAAKVSFGIAPAGGWTITDNYDVNPYGSLGIVPGDSPLLNPTTVAEPGAPAQAVMAENDE